MIDFEKQILNLKKENSNLKSILLHDQLKYGGYSYKNLKYDMDCVLNSYRNNKSLVKSAHDIGFDVNVVLKWYFEGQKGDRLFKFFSDEINRLNQIDENEMEADPKPYEIVKIEENWVYTYVLDGEKYSLIANDLDRLKQKVKSKNFPID